MLSRLSCVPLLRATGVVLLSAGMVLGLLTITVGAQAEGPVVDVLEVDGALDRAVVGYLTDAIAKAEREQVEAVVVQLDTPGALGINVADVVEPVRRSAVPVAVWVGPPGAAAAGAGVHLAEAAHVAAMAPGAILGPATPAVLDRSDAPAGDTAARDGRVIVATGDEGIGPDGVPDDAAPRSRVDRNEIETLDDRELVDTGLVDFVTANLEGVLRELDGRTVELAEGRRTLDIDPVTTSVRFNNPGLWTRVLHTVANPTLAYLLLVAGALAMLFELYQPGFGVAGISGLVLFGLALYGLLVLPTRWWAFALIVVGLLLLAADLAVAGLGALTAGGAVMLATGSVFLFGGAPSLRLSWPLVAFVVFFNLLFFVVIMTVVLRAQGVQAMAGAERVIGKAGIVRSMLNPEGHVFVDGALWRARAPADAGKVATGTAVRIVGMNDGLTLDVEVLSGDRSSPVG